MALGPTPAQGAFRQRVGMGILMTGFFVFLFGTVVAAVTGIVHPVLAAMLGLLLMMGGGFVFAMAVEGPVANAPVQIPSAPTIQIRLTCASCGASLDIPDASGAARCRYCESRVLVH